MVITPGQINVKFNSLVSPGLRRAHKDILHSKDTDPASPTYGQPLREYFLRGGRGSTKSSLISLEIVRHVVENTKSNAVVFVKVADTIRDSVYQQILWAIDHLELNAFFKCTVSPFRCTYLPTGQVILFRGLDKAGKIKGIKPPVGYFDIVWFEELTEFNGMEDCRSVIQSALRGGDEEDESIGENVKTWEFYSYNPPPTIANWVNVEANKTVEGRKVYDSTYLTVPPRWLRKDFFIRADILKKSNPRAYAHEYLGWVTGTGGNIFNNLEIRNITDKEISETFDNRLFGLDWGFANDPFVWLAMHFDRNHQTLYIFDEIVALGERTQETAAKVRRKMERIGQGRIVYADCAEPDSIADYNAWGVKCEGAPKPHGNKWSGRDYEFKALQDLKKIVVDKTYCPKTAEDFQRLEYPKTPHGDFKSEYPHTDPGDACRYGTFFALRDAGLLTI
jgi:phage terminase large subunit